MKKLGFIQDNHTPKTVEQTSLIVPNNQFTHAICIGQTGCGKTTSFIHSNLDNNILNGHGILLYDYKSKEHRSVKFFAKKHNRLSDVLELGLPYSASCNLIKYFNEKELKAFVISIMNLNAENDYWSTSASNLCSAIWKVLSIVQTIIEEADLINNKKSYLSLVERYKIPVAVTFFEIANICKSIVSIASFLDRVEKLCARLERNTNDKIQSYSERHDNEVVKSRFMGLLTSVLSLKSIIKNGLQPLQVFKDSLEEQNKSTTFQTMILSMSSTFSSIADNKNFNDTNGIDLVDELNNGKIIVIHSQELSNPILANLTGSVLNELSKRVTQTNIKPISIFIDEAQRVLSGEVDIYADVLRESKVNLLLSVQNYSLLKNALGKSKFYSLIQNLSTTYHFKNASDHEELEISKLEIFEYYKNNVDEVHKAKPIFLDDDEIFNVELEYFKINKIYDKLNIDEKDRDKVILFSPSLFQKNMINLKSRDGEIITIKLRNKNKELASIKYMDELIYAHQITIKHKKLVQQNNAKKRQPRLSDLVGQTLEDINEFMGSEEQ